MSDPVAVPALKLSTDTVVVGGIVLGHAGDHRSHDYLYCDED